MKNTLLILAILFLFSGCADVEHIQACAIGHTYGFWGGLWHGMIAPFSFVGRLFSDNISIYAVNNNGGWYDFGFILGIGGLSTGTSKATRKNA